MLYVDDDPVHADAAAALGFASLHFTGADALADRLGRAGLLA